MHDDYEPNPIDADDMPHREWTCEHCRAVNSHLDAECQFCEPERPEDDEPGSDCAHEWAYTGTAYGGDDHSYFGEGRCYCIHCGADGDA